jgi:hypothetical protein
MKNINEIFGIPRITKDLTIHARDVLPRRRRLIRKRRTWSKLAFREEANKRTTPDPCWDNYEQVGWKNKKGRKVPNCVPKNK